MTEKRRRNERLSIRLSKEENDFFEECFKKSNLKFRNDFVLHTLRRSKIINIKINDPALNEIHHSISEYGNRINQIARRINSTNSIYQEDIDEILEIKNQIENTKTRIHSLYREVKKKSRH